MLRAYGEATTFEQAGDTLTFFDAFDEPVVELARVTEDGE